MAQAVVPPNVAATAARRSASLAWSYAFSVSLGSECRARLDGAPAHLPETLREALDRDEVGVVALGRPVALGTDLSEVELKLARVDVADAFPAEGVDR
ncbi:MAG: hypothetical protein ACF8SC_11955 [Phycisphaerales bacterium JB037]